MRTGTRKWRPSDGHEAKVSPSLRGVFDDLPLMRREPAHPFRVIGRELVGHFLERTGQLVERFARDEARQDDIDAVVASREMMDRADARASFRGSQERNQVGLVAVERDATEQLDSVRHWERAEMVRREKAEERLLAGLHAFEAPLRGGHDAGERVGPQEAAPVLLALISEAVEKDLLDDRERSTARITRRFRGTSNSSYVRFVVFCGWPICRERRNASEKKRIKMCNGAVGES